MKLRRITARRFCDDETGTFYDFDSDMTDEAAVQQVKLQQEIFLKQYPGEDWFGTDRILPKIGKRKRRKPDSGL